MVHQEVVHEEDLTLEPFDTTAPAHAYTALGAALGTIQTPEHAQAVLREKSALLHTLTHNAAHFGTLAFNDLEQVIADVRWLLNYIRSKV